MKAASSFFVDSRKPLSDTVTDGVLYSLLHHVAISSVHALHYHHTAGDFSLFECSHCRVDLIE